ncbi:ArsR/SmtB family transcription factor [Actinoplanes teichomyceticus]|uniref:ArsR family transcriptional regulator n=1 Tax=Actinoplanes teichomyceticus TaxID=1867 RepID=A0A561WKF0_ACTTI|nr:helix-turn-helix domain-containing protein [Actinoplanes teichomyceticus]TWG24328.1 ArsR family transcriptional regulator [Actinoplanes teichomyceticus]GIF12823.1 putative HTH-type transcriptional regulator YczG [Actinoplanes teichomyceticus]
MTEVIEPALQTVTIDVVLSALADPVRLTFVRALDAAGDWTCGSDVLRNTGVTIGKSTLSHHMKVLRDAGLIRTRVDGIRRLVTLRYDEVEQRFPGLLAMLREHRPAPAAAGSPASTA